MNKFFNIIDEIKENNWVYFVLGNGMWLVVIEACCSRACWVLVTKCGVYVTLRRRSAERRYSWRRQCRWMENRTSLTERRTWSDGLSVFSRMYGPDLISPASRHVRPSLVYLFNNNLILLMYEFHMLQNMKNANHMWKKYKKIKNKNKIMEE